MYDKQTIDAFLIDLYNLAEALNILAQNIGKQTRINGTTSVCETADYLKANISAMLDRD